MVNYYLDTDVVGGDGSGSSWANALASMSAFISAIDITEASTLNCRGVAADTGGVSLNAVGADTYRLTIQGNHASKTRDNTKYRIASTTATVLSNSERYVTFNNIQIIMGNTITYYTGFLLTGAQAYEVILNNCLVDGAGGRGYMVGCSGATAGATVQINNLIAYNLQAGGSSCGIEVNDADLTVTIKNSTIARVNITNSAGKGISQIAGTVNVYNTAVIGCFDDFYGTFGTISYCASIDGDGTNAVTITQTASDFAALVTDYINGDFSVKDTSSQLYNSGSSANRTSADFLGSSWVTNDIGAFVYVSGSVTKTVTDSGSGSDTIFQLLNSLSISDSGAGVDGFGSMDMSIPVSDNGQGSESVISLIDLSVTDTASAVDAVTQILNSLLISDTGSALDSIAQLISDLSVTDSGSGSDAVNLLTEILKTITETASGSDEISIPTVTLSVSDSGLAADLISALSVALSIDDSGFGSDLIDVIKTQLIAIADSGSGSDSVSMSVSLTVSDVATALDAIGQILNSVSISDTGHASDSVVKTDLDLLPQGKVKITFTMKIPGVNFSIKKPGVNFTLN